MRLSFVLAGLLAPFFAQAASAQFVTRPTVVATPIPLLKPFNIDAILNSDSPVTLQWTATVNVGTTYEWAISYDTIANTSTVSLVPIQEIGDIQARNQGTVISGLPHRFFLRPREIIQPEHRPCQPGAQNTAMQNILVYVYAAGMRNDPNMQSSSSGSWVFNYDSKEPPTPTNVQVEAGSKNVQVTWTAPSDISDVNTYEVWFCPDASKTDAGIGVDASVSMDAGTSTTTADGGAGDSGADGGMDAGTADSGRPDVGSSISPRGACEGKPNPKLHCLTADGDCVSPQCEKRTGIGKTQTKFSVQGGLVNGRPVEIVVHAVDLVGNPGEFTDPVLATPGDVTDFFDLYKQQGGKENGGFCFVATAAYGSYAHPLVRVLREFRDRVMKPTLLGSGLVWLYYQLSPPLADQVRADQTLAANTRALLVPAAGLALLWIFAPLCGFLILGIVVVRRRGRSRRLGKLPSVAIFALLLATMGALAARDAGAEQLARSKSANETFGIGLLFKGGPYRPALGADTGGKEGVDAFARIYGSNPKPLYTIGADIELYRGFGTAGIGASLGFMQFVGKAFKGTLTGGATVDSLGRSSDTTVFNLLPLGLDAFYRFDWLADHASFPLVPYVRGGLGYHVWWATTQTGEISRYSPDTNAAHDVAAKGGKLGLTGTLGMAVLLNAFDEMSALSLMEALSIRGTYLFVEYQWSKIDGFGSQGFDLSDSTWNIGLYLEM